MRSWCLKPTHVSEITPLLSLHRHTSEVLSYLTTACIRNNCHVHRDPFAHKHLYIGSSTKPIDCQNIGDRVTSSLYPPENRLLISDSAIFSAFWFYFLGEFLLNFKFTELFPLSHAAHDVTFKQGAGLQKVSSIL